MTDFQDSCVPCTVCGVKPVIIDVGYGRNHSDLICPTCGKQTDTDGRVKWAIKDWNNMNKAKP